MSPLQNTHFIGYAELALSRDHKITKEWRFSEAKALQAVMLIERLLIVGNGRFRFPGQSWNGPPAFPASSPTSELMFAE